MFSYGSVFYRPGTHLNYFFQLIFSHPFRALGAVMINGEYSHGMFYSRGKLLLQRAYGIWDFLGLFGIFSKKV